MGTGGTPSLQSPKTDLIQRDSAHQAPLSFGLNIDGQPHSLNRAQRLSSGACSLARCHYSIFTVKFYGQAERAISNGQLSTLLHLHIRPINVVVFHGPS